MLLRAVIPRSTTIVELEGVETWQYIKPMPIITGYTIMPVVDFYLPAIKTNTGMGEVVVPLWGDVYLKLGVGKYCTNCLKPHRGGGLLCDECEAGSSGKFLRCLFGRTIENCTIEHPSCDFIENYNKCFRPYVVYVGQIGNQFKVGITPRYRDNDREGYLYRLIEQGLSKAVVFSGNGYDLMLPEATRLEQEISEVFNISKSISFLKKIEAIREEMNEVEAVNIFDEITKVFDNLEQIDRVSLTHNYMVPDDLNSYNEMFWDHSIKIVGKIIGFWGPVLFVKTADGKRLVNASWLVGHRIIAEV